MPYVGNWKRLGASGSSTAAAAAASSGRSEGRSAPGAASGVVGGGGSSEARGSESESESYEIAYTANEAVSAPLRIANSGPRLHAAA